MSSDGNLIHHVFGPVPTRRLGRSLGIDPLPLKTCDFNCVYCQLGRTPRLTTRRKRFVNASDLFAEVVTAVARHGRDAIDWITFVGSGETTLFSRLGSVIRFVQTATRLPVAVITNGSLLSQPCVRRELVAADAVLPSLDAGSEEVYRRINRPHRSLTFTDHVEGLEAFRREYNGRLWVEVMLVKGINDTPSSLDALARLLRRIAPDEIHLTLPDRPPSEPWVEAPEASTIARATELLGATAATIEPAAVTAPLTEGSNLAGAVAAVLARHPMHEEELVRLLGEWAPGRWLTLLAELGKRADLQTIERPGGRFWCSSRSLFSDADRSRRDHHHIGPAA
jgi:wyosine [tRNA(Phe)-imidazoG37] synthetase (radical SAM superfamily)